MSIGRSFSSMSKSTIRLYYDSYLIFIIALKIVQIKNPTLRTDSLNIFSPIGIGTPLSLTKQTLIGSSISKNEHKLTGACGP
jgi:hypothetical protein